MLSLSMVLIYHVIQKNSERGRTVQRDKTRTCRRLTTPSMDVDILVQPDDTEKPSQTSWYPEVYSVQSNDTEKPSQIVSDVAKPRASSVPLRPSGLTVGYVYAAEMTGHFNPAGHPESPTRIVTIYQTLVTEHYTPKMKWIPIRPVRRGEALLVHSEDHWDKVLAIQCK